MTNRLMTNHLMTHRSADPHDKLVPRLTAHASGTPGVRNAVVMNADGREYPKLMGGFDRVLLDAPCSGLGVISKDPSVKAEKSYADVQRCQQLQKELLLAAIDSCNADQPGNEESGIIVYSTCSVRDPNPNPNPNLNPNPNPNATCSVRDHPRPQPGRRPPSLAVDRLPARSRSTSHVDLALAHHIAHHLTYTPTLVNHVALELTRSRAR